jgi:hypothetical protein
MFRTALFAIHFPDGTDERGKSLTQERLEATLNPLRGPDSREIPLYSSEIEGIRSSETRNADWRDWLAAAAGIARYVGLAQW